MEHSGLTTEAERPGRGPWPPSRLQRPLPGPGCWQEGRRGIYSLWELEVEPTGFPKRVEQGFSAGAGVIWGRCVSQAGPSASVPEAQHPQEATWKENRFPGERTLSRGAGEEGGPWPRTVLQGDKEAGVLLSRGGHSTAMNLTSAVPKVTNTPTSVLPPPARPPARPANSLCLQDV